MKAQIKEKTIAKIGSRIGSISGITSIMGSWQVCHNICLAAVMLLGIIGITVNGMPLLFLTKLALPLWSLALSLLIITVILYAKKKCISKNMIVFNSGLIIAGIPFQSLQKYSVVFWIIGGTLVLTAIIIFTKNKIKNHGGEKHEKGF